MAGKPSTANDKARAAFERSGGKLSAKELARRYKLALSTVYRAEWFARRSRETGNQPKETTCPN